uniref:Uncharacterized protein n=1 Tax=Oryza glumipatula TaxID=40148 RepID=A0A0E0A563_9ORYZ
MAEEEPKKNEGEMALLHARVGSRLHAVVRLGVAAMAAVLARPVLLRRVVVRRRVAVLLRRSRVPGHRGGREHEHGKRQRHQQPLQQSRHGWTRRAFQSLPSEAGLHFMSSPRMRATPGLPFQNANGSRSGHRTRALSRRTASSVAGHAPMFTSGHPQNDQSGNTTSSVVASLQYRYTGGASAGAAAKSAARTRPRSSQANMMSTSGTRPA